jgi:anthranilate synthase component 1
MFTVVTKKMLGDIQTPVSIYLRVRDLYPQSALLESSDYHGGDNSFSYIAFCPLAYFSLEDGKIIKEYPDGKTETSVVVDYLSVSEEFDKFLKSFRFEKTGDQPVVNGFFGYTAFESVTYFDNIKTEKRQSDLSMPEMKYTFYKYIIAVDHFRNELTLIENLKEKEKSELDKIESMLNSRNFAIYDFKSIGQEESDITDEEYKEMVTTGKKACYRGDVFQIVLSRRFKQRFEGDDFTLYRNLRSINPSPYLFYFDYGSFRIFGSSPEAHLIVKKSKAYINPIAGTFRRTGDDEKDLLLAEKLRTDPKENAEHVMLVDLARNDLSRNAGDVKVEIFREVQYFSHVLHLVSTVSGVVKPETNIFRLFADTFPAGTLSGAPKIKAIELINRIEKQPRGIYGGCIGYIGFDGSFNQAITIRSFLSKDNMLYYQAGAGIVAKSKEEDELQEVNNKLAALMAAIKKSNVT